MKIAYTVCSLNRLGQVLSLGQSLLKHNPHYKFIIGLADEIEDKIETTAYTPFEFISLSQLNLREQKHLVENYNIFELSCALKPYYGTYIMEQHQPEILLYFDTDINIYSRLNVIENAFNESSILITPHFTHPVPDDGKYPLERDVLNAGLYNGGFIGLKNDEPAKAFLSWWRKRMENQGYYNVCEGMMVDQLWLNLAPLYFKEVGILNDPGYNCAYWNLHERTLSWETDGFRVNGEPLIFFHFSGFRPETPEKLSLHQNRYEVRQHSALSKLLTAYAESLDQHQYSQHLSIPCSYASQKPAKHHPFVKRMLIKILFSMGYKLEKVRKL